MANGGSLAAARGTIRGQACRHATRLDNRTDTTTTCMNINNTVTDTTAPRPHGGGNGPPSPEAACQDEPKRNGAMGQGTGWLGLAQQHPAHAPTPLRSPRPATPACLSKRRAYFLLDSTCVSLGWGWGEWWIDRVSSRVCLKMMGGHYYMNCLNRQARTSLTTSAIVFCSAWSILWVCGYGGGTLSVTAHRGISDATAATRTMQTSQHTHQAGHVLLGKVGEVELLLDGHGELDEVCCARTDGRR